MSLRDIKTRTTHPDYKFNPFTIGIIYSNILNGWNIMNAIKEDDISLVKQMLKYSTLEDIMEHLYVMQKILKGKKERS